eukprot:CAMPEP_0114488372 /NCGR_PEP_ID=MMETSP0109-20121206/1290_1 /TAXON_ID=29199 /ORGANISM="Chlorarachnion reptans, Strain CCCM449" /LENGTH=57 /DNA_ID=CAMNT_0001664751 /DNA_START=618 /DNA_END=791 /DNA_ORIENTATION=-
MTASYVILGDFIFLRSLTRYSGERANFIFLVSHHDRRAATRAYPFVSNPVLDAIPVK